MHQSLWIHKRVSVFFLFFTVIARRGRQKFQSSVFSFLCTSDSIGLKRLGPVAAYVLIDTVDLMSFYSYCGCFHQFQEWEQTSTVLLAAPIYTHLNRSSSFVDKFCIKTETASPLAHSEKSSRSHLSTSVIIHSHISSQAWTPAHYFQQTVIILDAITRIMKFPSVPTSRPNIRSRKLASLSDTLTFHDTTVTQVANDYSQSSHRLYLSPHPTVPQDSTDRFPHHYPHSFVITASFLVSLPSLQFSLSSGSQKHIASMSL